MRSGRPASGPLGLVLLATTALACGSAPPPPPRKVPKVIATPKNTAPAKAPASASWLPSHAVAELEDENALVYHARRGPEGLLLFTGGGHWWTRPLGPEGARSNAPLDIGPANDIAIAALKPMKDGYLAVWVEKIAKNELIKALPLDAMGKPIGEAINVAQIADELSWIDVLPNDKGALLLWEIAHDDKSDIFVVPMKGGKLEGAPLAVARGALGWQAIATARGAALATVEPALPKPAPKAAGKKKQAAADAEATSAKLGRVLVTEIDSSGKPAAPVELSPEPSAQLDVEIVELEGKYLIAWTDERNIDANVFVASLEPGGKVIAPPHRATTPLGEQALVSLIASPYVPDGGARSKRALVAWEDLLRSPHEGRLIHLATLGPDGAIGRERATLVFSASGPPDLVPAGDGFAALSLAPAVSDEATPAQTNAEAPVWPAYVRFSPGLEVLASEPIRSEAFAATEGIPYLTRGLGCHGETCLVLASNAGAKAQLSLVELPVRESPWKAPAWRNPDDSPPHPVSVNALFDGDHLSKVVATNLPQGGALSAWVTYHLESAGDHAKPKNAKGPKATLAVRAVGADGALGKTVVVSNKALSIGGVAIATTPEDKGKNTESVIAWVEQDKGVPQVFAARIGPDGSKLQQKAVTTIARKKRDEGPNEASDVAIAADGAGGYVIAWVDTRDGNPEVYAARLDRSLTKVVQDQRITEAPGDSAEVQIAVKGDHVVLIWSDARLHAQEGRGDIYVARLDPKTLKKAAPETRIFASALHSRTPQITKAPKGFLVYWIEDTFADPKAEANERGLRIATLDDKGALVGVPELVQGEDKAPIMAASIRCQEKACRGALTEVAGEVLTLNAFELAPGSKAGAQKTLGTLTGAVTEDVSPAIAGPDASWLFFADDSTVGTGRVRWMQLKWPETNSPKK